MAVTDSDSCGTCDFNAANRGRADRALHGSVAYTCQVRGINIDNPFWTYCYNHPRRNPLLMTTPRGPLWAAASLRLRQIPLEGGHLTERLYLPPEAQPPPEGNRYRRVPYYEEVRPLDSDEGRCAVCGEVAERTIALRLPGQGRRCFCSATHYLQHWLEHAADAELYRGRRPVSFDIVYGDLLVLGEELAHAEAEFASTLDKKPLLELLSGLEGALVQIGQGYVDIAAAEQLLRAAPRADGGDMPVSRHILRAWVQMARAGVALREEPPDRQVISSALRGVRDALSRFFLAEPDKEGRAVPDKRWWQFWK